ncbi:hypothetical protein [Actinophytocola sp.]|uniref:hypothetical protein n=1 Tax=Actinophytocola sp. TaxID=1872138 RepID=UPI002ED65DF3
MVETEAEISPMVLNVLADLGTYGGPFFAQYPSLREINEKLENTAKINFDLAHLAVGYALAGERSNARTALVRLQGWAAQQPFAVAQQTERFISAFRAHFVITGL